MDALVIPIRCDFSHRRQLWLVVLYTGLIMSGCARGPRESMGHLLDNVPSRKHASATTVEQPLSSVTANAPGQAGLAAPDESDPAPAARTSTSEQTLVAGIEDGPSFGAPSPLESADPIIEIPGDPPKAASGPKIWDRRMVSAAAENTVNRLKKALSTDARRESPAIDPLSRTHPLRVRVDGLQQRAAELLAAGDLQEAKLQAERAVDLSGSLALEFLPNEEHPEDLLQRITVAIDELDQAPSANPRLGAPGADMTVDSEFPLSTTNPLLPTTDTESLPSHSLNSGTVAANRPLRLASRAETEPSNRNSTELVAMEPILNEDPRGGAGGSSLSERGLAAPTSADRLRLRSESGPLLLPVERRPSTPQVAEAAPLPAFRSTVAPRQVPVDPERLGTGFEWSDLWPLGVLGILMLCFTSGLFLRRLVMGH